jgi:Uncharacterized protein related to capsule biosynthesis enzymes
MENARVMLWGSQIGAVSWVEDRQVGVFQYTPDFVRSGIQPAPLMMPVREYPYEFPDLAHNTFRGLPGMLADSLPDKFGNALINAWLVSQGRSSESFNPVERLCYTGSRGMGALEYEPAIARPGDPASEIEIADLVALANRVLDERRGVNGEFTGKDDRAAFENILRVGTSAGGARAKAILAWNPQTAHFRSGQLPHQSGYQYWILKFDGISKNSDKELADPQGYGKIEFAYFLMAGAAGIEMSECRLYHEGGRSHFMTKRFDRTDDGAKLHMQSLGAMTHADFNLAAAYSYEEALQTMKRLNLPQSDLEQQVQRACFNVLARNQDDHVKNIVFLMNRKGEWRLSPAYDVTYAYDPLGKWTSRHQMSLQGKRDDFTRGDLIAFASVGGMKARRAEEMLAQTAEAVRHWPDFAETAGVPESQMEKIRQAHCLSILEK